MQTKKFVFKKIDAFATDGSDGNPAGAIYLEAGQEISDEDPATGTGSAALGYTLLVYNRWDGAPMSLEQNGDRAHPNIVKLSATHTGPGSGPEAWQVTFGGGARVRISGEYFLA